VKKKEVAPGEAYRLLTPGCVVLVGSQKGDKPNVMAASWQMPVSKNPPLVSVAVAKGHLTAEYIKESGAFTLNVPGYGILAQVHRCGTVSGRHTDKFSAAGLTPVPGRCAPAPLVAECTAGVECRLWQAYDGGDHWIFVGEVLRAEAAEDCFDGQWTYARREQYPVHHLGGSLYAAPGTLAEVKLKGESLEVEERTLPKS